MTSENNVINNKKSTISDFNSNKMTCKYNVSKNILSDEFTDDDMIALDMHGGLVDK